MIKTVNDDTIDSIVVYTHSFWLFRLDVFPFLISYAILLSVPLLVSNNNLMTFFSLICTPACFILHLIMFLVCRWDIGASCLIGCRQTKSVAEAEFVLIFPTSYCDKKCISYIERNLTVLKDVDIFGNSFPVARHSFYHQKMKYDYDETSCTFSKIKYPTSGNMNDISKWCGHEDLEAITFCLLQWGRNEFSIPVPNFLELFLDHLTAPFFVFQVICLFLWSLDDYWYYSVFTLVMLLVFEGMMCRQRQSSLTMLRNMRRPPVAIWTFRMKQWVVVLSDQLVPGDLISLSTAFVQQPFEKKGTMQECVIPCDALLISGSCLTNEAMLTGESVPQVKEALIDGMQSDVEMRSEFVNLGEDSNIDPVWRRNLLLGGTTLLQQSVTSSSFLTVGDSCIPRPPNNGCVAITVRTGFGTCQGGLMRKIIFASERVGNSQEIVYFICILVFFAMIAAGSVLIDGLYDERRNRFRLVLHCIMIVTCVVPPELPMELSLSVTNSLAALSKQLIYCTEPYRISFAGKVDVLCFDKTGTLTKDEMVLCGVAAPCDIPLFTIFHGGISNSRDNSDCSSSSATKHANLTAGGNDDENYIDSERVAPQTDLFEAAETSDIIAVIMGACHDLTPYVNKSVLRSYSRHGAISGDPMERAAMIASGFVFDEERTMIVHNGKRNLNVTQLKKFPFSSALKRMSCVVHIAKEGFQKKSVFILTKGAPEVMLSLLSIVPSDYSSNYRYHMSKGRRVLALACKRLMDCGAENTSVDRIICKSRSVVEAELVFAGFLVFDCDLKPDSKSVIRELRNSDHKTVMITGDSVFTAVDVAKKLGMLNRVTDKFERQPLVLEGIINSSSSMTWKHLIEVDDERLVLSELSIEALNKLSMEFTLCVTGPVLLSCEGICGSSNLFSMFLKKLCPYVTIFARVSPVQKESIVIALNSAGRFTLMCGDGTNDVGSLKAAHVGISIVNNPILEQALSQHKDINQLEDKETKGNTNKKVKGSSARERAARATKELQQQEIDPGIVKLGDASVASAFTARRTSIDSVLTVIRQGRCTLVTTIQVYKILSLNCLVSAFMMSALYMKGLKQGDTQMTCSGLIVAALFFFLSQAKPLQRIDSRKPPTSIFATAVCLSIVGQFLVHLFSLMAVLVLCNRLDIPAEFSQSLDGKFFPNIVNSSIFLMSAFMQVNNFVINYRGHPFTQSLTENLLLWRSVQIIYGLLLIVVGGQLEPLNDFLQLTPFPTSEFQANLIGVILCNFSLALIIEHLCRRME